MKKSVLLLFVFLGATFAGFAQDNPLDRSNRTEAEFEESAACFLAGDATNGEEYFVGVLAYLIIIESNLKMVQVLDERDAPLSEFKAVISKNKSLQKDARKALDIYEDKTWPKRDQMHEITMEWLNSVDGLFKNYIKKLAEPMSRPDDTWSEKELDFFDNEYIAAYDAYLQVDSRWVDFQYKFAEANGFVIKGTVDMDGLDGEGGGGNSSEGNEK